VSHGESSRALTGLFALWGSRKGEEETVRAERPAQSKAVATASAGDRALSTKAFGKFLSALSHREAPVLLDLGPVVGSNINFFGERLGCKFFVEDVYDNVEKLVRAKKTTDELVAFFDSRFPQPDASFDGILCWDILDYLDKRAAQALARQMTRLLKPGGALLSFFGTVAQPGSEYTRFLVVDDQTLKHRAYPAVRGRQQVFVNRDINLMFEGLTVAESYLLMTKTREIVFRKPEKKTGVTETTGPATAAPMVNATESLRMAKVKPGGRIYTSPAAAKGTV
jgi:SAM-dependent methyltransferase